MKSALLIFIRKSGDPLQYKNYRGISLLSCFFKLITGIPNSRLQRVLMEETGLDPIQGANRKESTPPTKLQFFFTSLQTQGSKACPFTLYTQI
jgi:hypothetical protein